MTVAYVNQIGEVAVTSDVIATALMAPTLSDRLAFMPALLLGDKRTSKVPELEELAADGLSLVVKVDWLDDRRWFPFWFVSRRHRTRTTIDLRSYVAANLKALRVVDSTLLSELQDANTKSERWRREESARAQMDRVEMPPGVRARLEAGRISAATALWQTRARIWSSRLTGTISSLASRAMRSTRSRDGPET